METIYKTSGVCSREIKIETEGTVVKDVKFVGGCAGNLLGIKSLVQNMEIDEVISRLGGIKCGNKSTSCPDQLACALQKIKG